MISEKSTHKSKLFGGDSPLTARQAFLYVEPATAKYDKAAKLVLVVSGEDIDAEGRSHLWEFFFDFPMQRAQGIFRIELDEDEDGDNFVAYYLIEEIKPVSKLDQRPALPIPFRDSPEVIQAFANQGVDFIAGDTSMYLSGEVLPNSKAIWKIFAYGVEYQASFV